MVYRPYAPEDAARGTESICLVIVDGMSRVILSDEVCLSKDARDAVLILLRAFARWGLPGEILSDNGGAFISLLYRLFLAMLQVKISFTIPGHPWENG
jgi:transposase InsO family protein